ncbi:MAG: dihydroorotase [Bdellovibrionales bacterium]|nr:dihydroorotase [Bdellovibrionales bacterium]
MSKYYDYILKSGEIVTRKNGKWQKSLTDLGLKDGKITCLGDLKAEKANRTFDCNGLTILPGLIDSQVHFREPGLEYKEDLESGSRGAVLGGITAIFDMPNTKPSITNLESWHNKIDRAKNRMWCNYAFYVGATLNNIEELPILEKQPTCCGVKIFMGSSTGDLLVDQLSGLKKILSSIKRNVAVHSENEQRLKERATVRVKDLAYSHTLWRDEEVAFSSTQDLIKLALETGKKIHVLHVTTEQEMQLLSKNKHIATVEVTPQHLTFSAPEIYDRIGTYAQMNPPIRSEQHRQALWKALNQGVVDVLGSDHAPHTREEKDKGYPLSPSGMPGVQTIVPIMLDHVNKGHLSLFRLVELLAERPSKLFKLKNKGSIQIGNDADFTIVDLKRKWRIENSWMATKCGWTPFDGYKVVGYPTATMIGGQFIQIESQLNGQPKGNSLEFTDIDYL